MSKRAASQIDGSKCKQMKEKAATSTEHKPFVVVGHCIVEKWEKKRKLRLVNGRYGQFG